MKKKNNTIRISYKGIICIVLFFVAIIVKLVYVSYSRVVDGLDIKAYAAGRNTRTDKITASRGTIYSSNDEALAKNVNAYTVIAIIDEKYPNHVEDKEYTANTLSEHLNMSPEAILKILNQKGFQVEFGVYGKDISEKKKKEIEALALPGIGFISGVKRYYPYGDFASYIVGYAKNKSDTDSTIVGELGVEMYYDNDLRGKDGSITYQQDAYGYQIADTPVIEREATSGKDIYLTIDSNIQMYLENALGEMEKTSTFEWVTVTVANAKTGAILGSATSPSYDPNKLNITDWNTPLVSRQYEPGSTMKIFSFMSAMEEGIYKGDELYMSGTKMVGRDKVTDWNKVGWGNITYDKGFTYSSNVAAANLGLELGREKLIEYYKKFGFGSKTGIEMANEYSGTLKPHYELEVANAAFGQGITTTPIQNIQALTSLANEGVVVRPYLVSKVIDPNTKEVIYEGKRTELGRAVSKSTVDKTLELMNETVNSEDTGVTGRVYKTKSTTLVGKTGTAQIASKYGGYESGSYNNIRSFAGLFPYEDPEYVIYISVRKLQGGSGMSKTVKSVVESIAKYKNLDQLIVQQDKSKIINIENYINKNTEDVKNVLKEKGAKTVIIGNGTRVIDQYPNKGDTIVKDNKVFLLTNDPNITIPSMTDWTSNEVTSYCKLAKIKCNTTGFGRVVSQSLEPGTVLEENANVDFTLSKGDEPSEEGQEEPKEE